MRGHKRVIVRKRRNFSSKSFLLFNSFQWRSYRRLRNFWYFTVLLVDLLWDKNYAMQQRVKHGGVLNNLWKHLLACSVQNPRQRRFTQKSWLSYFPGVFQFLLTVRQPPTHNLKKLSFYTFQVRLAVALQKWEENRFKLRQEKQDLIDCK